MNRPNGPNRGGDVASRPGKAMSSKAAERVYGRHSGYRKLKAYQVAELLYDFTCRFCDRYVPKNDRHHDQMVLAARSGYQNIAEGSEDSATSKKLEMNLTNVARASLDEARKDYLKHLTRRGLRRWQEDEPVFLEARKLRPRTLEDALEKLLDQRQAMSLVFLTNAFCVLSNAVETKVGSLTAEWEHFYNWFRAEDEREQVDRAAIERKGISLEAVIAGLFPRERLLDYVENFILGHNTSRGGIASLATGRRPSDCGARPGRAVARLGHCPSGRPALSWWQLISLCLSRTPAAQAKRITFTPALSVAGARSISSPRRRTVRWPSVCRTVSKSTRR